MCVLVLCSAVDAADVPFATVQLQHFRQRLLNQKLQGDQTGLVATALEQKAFLNDASAARLEVVRAELRLGRVEAAMADARRFLALGISSDIFSSPDFAPLHPEIDAAVENNERGVSSAKVFAQLEPGLLPEDIDVDPVTQRVFVSSVLRRRVVAVHADGRQEAFAVSAGGWPIFGLKVDAKRRILWTTAVAPEGWTSLPSADRGHSEIRAHDLDRGTLLIRVAMPSPSSLGDIALAANGDPLVSDGGGRRHLPRA